MPATSRLLYFDLGMSADDDGYCEWYPVMQMTGAKEQDFEVLRSNELIFIFDNEVLIIKDWKENNFIRSDRYQPSKYLGKYEGMLGLPFGIPTVDPGKDRLGNISVAIAPPEKTYEEEDTKKPRSSAKYPHSKEVFSWFPLFESSWRLNTTELKHAELLYVRGEKKVKSILAFCWKNHLDEFFPSWETPTQLERNWNKIIKFADRNGL